MFSIFDYNDGDFIMKTGSDMGMDLDGNMMLRVGDNIAMDLNSVDLHFVSGWDDDDED